MSEPRFYAETVVLSSVAQKVRTIVEYCDAIASEMLELTGGESGRDFTVYEKSTFTIVMECKRQAEMAQRQVRERVLENI